MNEETLFTWKCKVCGHERQIDSRYEVPIKFIENREEYHCYYCERKKEFNENDLQEILEWIKYNKRDELNFEELRTNIIKVIEEAQKHLTALAALRAKNKKLKTWDCTYCDIKALNAELETRIKELEDRYLNPKQVPCHKCKRPAEKLSVKTMFWVGEDYSRRTEIETYHCNGCGSIFTEVDETFTVKPKQTPPPAETEKE